MKIPKYIIYSLLLSFFVFKGVFGQYIQVGDTVSVGIIYNNIKDSLVPFSIADGSVTANFDIDNDNIDDIQF